MTNQISPMGTQMHTAVLDLQSRICDALTEIDPKGFQTDTWERPNGGGGKTRVLQDGNVIEKGGVNVSAVHGEIHEKEQAMFTQILAQQGQTLASWKNARFFATGVSLVIHPHNPMAPTTHANFRYFELTTDTETIWWFGGGADLTPYYLFDDDARHFHTCLKKACDQTDPAYYAKFKDWCDTYFYIDHREESRGIGGIFYDYLNQKDPETLLAFSKDAGQAFIDAYIPILQKRHTMTFTEDQKRWQLLRRGRYVEFNLVHDRGTKFGLATKGRIESILMSLPKHVSWEYDMHPEPDSPEDQLVQILKKPRNWLST